MRRRLNLRWLAGSLVVLALVAVGIHFLHGYQVRRNAGALLALADGAERDGDWTAARAHLEHYLALAPRDTDAPARLALLQEKQAASNPERIAAFFALERVLRQQPEREDVRRRLATAAMTLRRHGDARDHLLLLVEAHPEDADLMDQLGQCEEGTTRFAEAALCYERSIRQAPQRLETATRLAALLRKRLQRPEDADRVMTALVEANPTATAAYLARARYRQQHGALIEAATDAALARRLAPDDAEVLLLSAEMDLAGRRLAEAGATLDHALSLHPEHGRLLLCAALREMQQGRRAQAVDRARRALQAAGEDAQLMWQAADLLIEAREIAEARIVLARLEKRALPRASVDFLRGRACVVEEKWAEGRRLLESVRAKLTGVPDLLKRAHLLLATCHQRLGDPEKEVAAYRAALALDPAWQPARLGLAGATAAAGHADEAFALCEKLADTSPEMRLLAARLLLVRTARAPAARRDWKAVERYLDDSAAEVKKRPEWTLLRVETLLAQDHNDDARKTLDAARAEQPKQVDFRLALAAFAVREKRFDQATVLLDEAERDLGDLVDIRLARAALGNDATGNETHARLEKLAENVNGYATADRARLFLGLGKTAARADGLALSRKLYARAAALLPNDLEVRLKLFQLAARERDAAAALQLQDEMRRIEGDDGALWRFADAVRRTRFGAAEDAANLKEARLQLKTAAQARPHWAPLALLDAELCEREGDLDAAIEQYKHAIALGERQPGMVRRVVQLLHERRRYAETQEVLRGLQEQAPLSGNLERLAAEVSLLNKSAPEETLEMARKAVAAEPNDARNQLWLGQMLAALDRRPEAEKAYRRALELKPDAADAWVHWILFQTRTGQKQAAETSRAEAARALGQAFTPGLQAICWEALGDRGRALASYAEALKASPGDAALLREAALFHLRAGELAAAHGHLRNLIAGQAAEGTARWARRTLALSLAATGDFARSKEALALMDENVRRPTPAIEDQRARALVLALRPGKQREAIAALEQSFAKAPASPEERFLLARLYEAERDWPQARNHLLDVLTAGEGKNALHIAYFVEALLRHDNVEEAAVWQEKLTAVEPRSWRTAEAAARLRVRQGKAAEAVQLLQKRLKANAAEILPSALLLDQLGQTDAAEALYRQAMKASKRPDAALALAAHLSRRGKGAEALDLCEGVAAQLPAEALAGVVAGVVRTANGNAADAARAERWLKAALAAKPRSPALLLALADLHDQREQLDQAQATYREVLKIEPNNAIACNNLAVMLALQDKGAEAKELTGRALDVAGPTPFLLDTRALAHMALGQHEQAVTDLEEALARQPTGTRYYHLARAYQSQKNRGGAAAALRKAKSLGLTAAALHPLERKAYAALVAEHEER